MKSSFCNLGECVAVEIVGDFVEVSHTATPAHRLVFTGTEWDAFIAGVRNGEFDRSALAAV